MSQSAIRYKGHPTYIKDEDLREFLKLLSFHVEDVTRNQNDLNWIADAIREWMDDHEGLPPGLRDIELDDVVISPFRVDALTRFLDGLLKVPIEDGGPYDRVRAVLIVERLLRELKSNT